MELTAITPSIGAMLDQLEPVLTPPLFSPAAVAGLRRLSQDCPPSHFLLFERHPGNDARVDLSVANPARPNGVLEFDLNGGGAPPAHFVTLPHGRETGEAELLSLAADLAPSLSDERRAALARFAIAQQHGESWITHLGIMHSRPGRPFRVNIGARSSTALRAFAEAVGCDDAARATLDRLLRLIEDMPLTLILALDVDMGPCPRLGLECYAYPPGNAFPALLERLVRENLFAAAEAEAILAWPGEARVGSARPEPFHSLDAFLGGEERGRVVRTLNHIKLVAEGGGAIEAKVYLAAYSGRGRQPGVGLAAA